MHDVLWLTGLAGGVLCLAGHLASPVRQWMPHAVALVAMLAMAPGAGDRSTLLAGAAVLGVACLWQMRAGCRYRRPAESVNLAAMAVLTAGAAGAAGAAGVERSHHGAYVPEGVASAALTPWPVLFLVACWVVARAGAVLVRQAWPSGLPARHPGKRALLLGETGSALMVTTMAVMIGLP
ncbi:hypothetical protein [Streptomyces sp. NPDC091212]|uniref:hypothetical protein n=1 Tax=Streptomyces sp. NPDC091212 TaxID=3155191 RepID=UPI003415B219